MLRWKQSSATVPLRIQPAAACKNRPARGLSKAVVDSLCCTAHMNGEATRMARVARAVLEPGSKRIPLGRIRVPNRGHQNDPGMTRRRMEGVCGLEIGRPAVHAVHLLRLARKMQIHRMECQDTAAEARGNAYTRSLESACGNSADVRLEVLREGARPPGECGASPGVATRDSGCSSGVNGSAPACCRCDARVRPQQRGCGVLSFPLRQVQRSQATLQQRGGAWGRQAGP